MKRIYATLLMVAAMLGGFTLAGSVAYAADSSGAAGTSESLTELLRMIADAFRGDNPTLGGVLAVVAGVTLIRKYGPLRWPWLNKTPWPVLLVAALSFASTAAAMMTAGAGLVSTLWPAAKLAIGAGGSYALVTKLGAYVLDRWGSKLPSWLKAGLGWLLWMFKKPGAAAIANAEQEGETAVGAAGPQPGAGDVDEVP